MTTSTYKIITDHTLFEAFVGWLPDLAAHEAYYLTLLGRKKYHESAVTDKTALKRFEATSKDRLIEKVEQLELPIGRYRNKKGDPVDQAALALYISLNPRSLKLAQKTLLKRLVDVALDENNLQNPAALALSEIQKAKSRAVHVDFDFDIEPDAVFSTSSMIAELVGRDSVTFLKTRGGFHALVDPGRAAQTGPKTWYNAIKALPGCDVVGDSLIPVPGSTQGGFTPHFFDPVRDPSAN